MMPMMQTGNRRRRRGIVQGLSAALLGLLVAVIAGGVTASPARADWLVTREGGKVETRGPWQIKGKLVVFTRADDGSLSSLRSTEVDLDASGKLTAEAKVQAAAPPPVEVPKKKLAVLTDQNFRKTAPPAAADGKAAADNKKPAAAGGPLSVGSWKRSESPEGDGLVIEGTLHNSTGDMIINGAVEVQLYNEVGDRVGTAQGLLTSTSVQPNGSVDFRASFPGVFTFADVKFQPQGLPLNMNTDDKTNPKPAEQTPPP
jgi:hypothetical protein